jgi:hypothetical protein
MESATENSTPKYAKFRTATMMTTFRRFTFIPQPQQLLRFRMPTIYLSQGGQISN